MAITPNTDLYLLKCPLESDQRNQLTFGSRSAQQTYFNGLPKLALEDFSYQRKDGYIRAPYHIDDIIGYNYVMYQNKNYSNRWFYAFITRMEYVSDKCTNIYIKTDVYQTWAMDITDKASYVEREHVNDDTIGANTIPEGLDTGEYVCNDVIDFIYADPMRINTGAADTELMVCAQVTTLTLNENDYFDQPTYNILNSVPQGLYIIAWPLSTATAAGLYSLTHIYDINKKGDAIISMFVIPKELAAQWTKYTGHGALYQADYYYPADNRGVVGIVGHNAVSTTLNTLDVPINTTLNGYQPVNNKLFVAPYNYFSVTNNNGTDIEFYYEDFMPVTGNTNGVPRFVVKGSFEQGGAVACYPTNSKRTTTTAVTMAGDGWTEGLNGGKLPTVSWTSDYYLNWEAANGKNIAIQTGLQAAGMGLGILNPLAGGAASHALDVETAVERGYFPDEQHMSVNAGGPLGSVVNFASQVANTQNSIRNAKMTPPQAKGNSATGTLAYASGNATKFTARKMSVRQEYARAIDGYFSMYGYKVNRVKIPNFVGRQNWNYIKTIGFNCEGDVPQADLQEYKNLFDTGITLWHNPTTFMDYSQNNNIV